MKASPLSVCEPMLHVPVLASDGVGSRSLPSHISKTVPSTVPFGPAERTRTSDQGLYHGLVNHSAGRVERSGWSSLQRPAASLFSESTAASPVAA